MAKDLKVQKNSPKESDKKSEAAAKAKEKDKKSGKPKKKKGLIKYFKDAFAEFKKVVWPTPKETTNNTVVVLVTCGIAALAIFGVDTLFGLLNGLLFK